MEKYCNENLMAFYALVNYVIKVFKICSGNVFLLILQIVNNFDYTVL